MGLAPLLANADHTTRKFGRTFANERGRQLRRPFSFVPSQLTAVGALEHPHVPTGAHVPNSLQERKRDFAEGAFQSLQGLARYRRIHLGLWHCLVPFARSSDSPDASPKLQTARSFHHPLKFLMAVHVCSATPYGAHDKTGTAANGQDTSKFNLGTHCADGNRVR
jgi:hypothetical protein